MRFLKWSVAIVAASIVASLGVVGSVSYFGQHLHANWAANTLGGLCIVALVSLLAYVVLSGGGSDDPGCAWWTGSGVSLPLISMAVMVATFSCVGFDGEAAFTAFVVLVVAVVIFVPCLEGGCIGIGCGYWICAALVAGVPKLYHWLDAACTAWWQWFFGLFG